MKSGNPVPAARHHDEYVRDHRAGYLDGTASQPVRDIQEIIAKLKIVTKRLEFPLRTMPSPNGDSAEAAEPGSPRDETRAHERPSDHPLN